MLMETRWVQVLGGVNASRRQDTYTAILGRCGKRYGYSWINSVEVLSDHSYTMFYATIANIFCRSEKWLNFALQWRRLLF